MSDRAIYATADARCLPLADRSVHMIATSPPYFQLRRYDTGDQKGRELGAESLHDCGAWARRSIIGYRGVPKFKEDGQGNILFVGRPPEPIYGPPAPPCGVCYVCNLRTWAAEMWRVLRDDGVMFLNLGDSYNAYNGNRGRSPSLQASTDAALPQLPTGAGLTSPGLKPKDLIGIPWRVALALQADGWYLRRDVIWEKPNAMPERVKDRPTTSHEYIFLLTKRPRYYYDAEAVKEPSAEPERVRADRFGGVAQQERGRHSEGGLFTGAAWRNRRSVWTVNTTPYAGAHFATWPPALVEIMVRAGTSERGVCPVCGAPWQRVLDKGEPVNAPRNPNDVRPYTANGSTNHGTGATTLHKVRAVSTLGWRPTCAHDALPVPAVVLDSFVGSGATLQVARKLGRVGLGFDLSETYLRRDARARLGHVELAAWGRGIAAGDGDHDALPLFASPFFTGDGCNSLQTGEECE